MLSKATKKVIALTCANRNQLGDEKKIVFAITTQTLGISVQSVQRDVEDVYKEI